MKKFLLLSFVVLVCLNVTSQSFLQTTIGSSVILPDNITRVDLNQDGNLDVLCFEGDTDIEYFENLGDGTYAQKNIYFFLDSPRYFEVEDMDNDGDLDIVACSIGDDQTVLLSNDGSENFTQSFITNGNSELTNPGYFTIADFDGDNLKDLIISGSSVIGDVVGLYFVKNLGEGSFASPAEIQANDEMIWKVVTGDFDGDKDLDVIVTRNSPYGDGGLYKVVNNGGGSFTYSAIDESFECDQLEKADMDGDNDLDFIIRRSDNSIFWYENSGSFTFTAHQISHTQTDLIYFEPVDAGDDQIMDIFFYTTINAAISESRFKVGVLVNDGTENFTEKILLDNQDEIEYALAVNLDNDGDVDFIIGSDQHSNVILYNNQEVNKLAQTISWSQDLTDLSVDETRVLTATASSGLDVSFTSSDETVVSVNGNSVTVHKAGTCTLTAQQGGDATYNRASDVIIEVSVVTTFVQSNSGKTVHIFPNPVDELVQVESDELICKVVVYDLKGSVIKSFYPVSNKTSLSVDELDAGVYLLSVVTEGGLVVKRMVKR